MSIIQNTTPGPDVGVSGLGLDVSAPDPAAALTERLFGSILGTFDILSIHIGDQLGLYGHLRQDWLTSGELAARAGMHERYAREWLELQAFSGLIDVEDAGAPALERRYHLSEAHGEVLQNTSSPDFLTPFARVVASAAVQMPALLDAYRSGDGVSWAQYGDHMRTGQGDANKNLFLTSLAQEWVPVFPGAADTLRCGGRVADIGCGEGWSSIAVALGFPQVRVDGIDLDPESVEAARRHAKAHGVEDRVTFRSGDASWVGDSHAYDLVTAYECVHDMANPVEVLTAMRQLAKPGAPVVVMDEKVAERFGTEPDPVEQMYYGMSLLICLPDGMSHTPSVGTGTVMRPSTLRGYAQAAGFADIQILDIDNDLFRFYLLTQCH